MPESYHILFSKVGNNHFTILRLILLQEVWGDFPFRLIQFK